MNALYSMLHPAGRYGRFLLDMSRPRPEPAGPVTGRGRRAAGLDHIRWIEREAARPTDDGLRIDLSRWYAWAEAEGGRRLARSLADIRDGRRDVAAVLNELDEGFDAAGEGLDREVARVRLERLAELWTRRVIPVERRVLRSPMDVLEAFTRVNRAGVAVSGNDLFFAAVRTLWPDAEQVVVGLAAALTPARDGDQYDPLVDRMAVLRVLARLAARAVQRADLLPLAIDRLAGVRGDPLIAAMRAIAADGSTPRARMAAVMGAVASRSALGFGLYAVDDRLWDPVLAWAAVHPGGTDSATLDAAVPAIDAFLVGASAFRWPEILRDRFGSLALGEALIAGLAGEPFPVVRLAQVGRGAFADLAQGRSRVPRAGTPEERQRLADANTGLLLSIVQRIEYRPQRDVFDWDHIYPRGQAYRMVTPGPHGWPRHHPDRWLVSSAGNQWGLDARINRAARDAMPGAKFEHVRDAVENGERPIWPEDCWWLSLDDRARFTAAGDHLAAGRVPAGMEVFASVVRERAERLVATVLAQLPDAARFAGDADEPATSPRQVPDISPALGLSTSPVPVVDLETGSLPAAIEALLVVAETYGSTAELRDLVLRARGLGFRPRAFKASIGLMSPHNGSVALVTLRPTPEGVVTWAQADVIAGGFPERLSSLEREVGWSRGEVRSPAELMRLADGLEAALVR